MRKNEFVRITYFMIEKIKFEPELKATTALSSSINGNKEKHSKFIEKTTNKHSIFKLWISLLMTLPLCSRLIHYVDQPQPQRANVCNAQTVATPVCWNYTTFVPHTQVAGGRPVTFRSKFWSTLTAKKKNLFKSVVVASHAVTRDQTPDQQKQDEPSKLPLQLVQLTNGGQIHL